MTEQRKNQRFDLRLPIELMRLGAGTKVAGETRNVSSSGVLFTAGHDVAVGEPIEYVITLPTAPGTRTAVRLRCMGTVVRESVKSAYAATLERYEFLREAM
jgi:hypothetical protein